ncbi:hypothetical protein [Natronomonas amylolytica]|uniref:hypothetical protein n=1 Tax=Natronomonas amylolytica TaxID=3108498 RepID=UPI0030091748
MGSDVSAGRTTADRVSVRAMDDGRGLRIDDRIERRRCEILTNGPVDPGPADVAAFRSPVDTAVAVTTDGLTFEEVSRGFVHGPDGPTDIEYFRTTSFGPGEYLLELSGPVKLYATVRGPMEVDAQVAELEISFERPQTVRIGARSYHERPAATVTATDDPVDVMAAVSTFGSALKTTGSERSYPTLRGHPPAIERGDELSVPSGLTPPAEDVHVEVPERLQDVLVVAPLAYYLGAPVRAGPEPRLVVDGRGYRLDGDDGFEAAVERTLKRTFFLDCIVRTAGPRTVPLYERRVTEDALDISASDLYGRSNAERLAAYMDVPYEAVAEYIPTWKLSARVEPRCESLETLPSLVNDLSVIRSPSNPSGTSTASPFGDGTSGTGTDDADGSSDGVPLQPERADSLERAWVGEGAPSGASKAIPAAFRNRLDRDRRDGPIEIVVVCNDDEMLEERNVVEQVYGSREELPMDVTVYEGLDTQRLRLLLESDVDFFHYIGHVDDEGLECPDGKVDAATLDAVSLDIFFLNACRSYQQGRHLIENGAVGGVVTLDDVINSGAIRIGKTLAKLLNYGFPLRSGLNIARDRSIVGSQYLVIGDGNADIAQVEPGVALLAAVDSTPDGYDLTVSTYPTSEGGMGTQFRPAVPGVDEVYLCPGTLPTFEVSAETVREYLSTSVFPVLFDGEFTWSDRATVPDAE